jgi:hypothetical protein
VKEKFAAKSGKPHVLSAELAFESHRAPQQSRNSEKSNRETLLKEPQSHLRCDILCVQARSVRTQPARVFDSAAVFATGEQEQKESAPRQDAAFKAGNDPTAEKSRRSASLTQKQPVECRLIANLVMAGRLARRRASRASSRA